jgi:hypothetical protein
LALVALATDASAARLYFTTSATSGAPKASTPDISLTPGQTTDLYVWVDLKGDGALGDGNDTWMAGYGINIVATNPGVVETVSSELYNPTVLGNPGPGQFPFQPRWKDGFDQPQINVGGAGSAILADNARGFSVNASGAAGIGFTGQGVTPGNFFPILDPLYDSTNDVFLAQRITLLARDSGPGSHTTGIVMQVGPNAFSIDNNPLVEPVFFGDGQVPVPNNAIGATDVTGGAHATITVASAAPARDALRFDADANASAPGAIIIPGPNGTKQTKNVAFPAGTTAGVVVAQNWTRDVFEVYFDVDGVADPEAAFAALAAQAGNGEPSDGYQLFLAPGPDDLGTGIDYDFYVTYPHTPGADAVIDFDFGGSATVLNVGVPEPSTFILGAIGCVALAGLRRRRSK